MLFQGRIEEEPHEPLVLLVIVHRMKGEVVKDSEIVLRFDRLLDRVVRLPGIPMQTVATRFAVEDCSIELILGSEVPEDDGLGHAGRFRDLFGRSPFESALREKIYGRLQDLLSPHVCRHPAGVVTIKQFVDQYSLLNE
jgi:hypothetical protein